MVICGANSTERSHSPSGPHSLHTMPPQPLVRRASSPAKLPGTPQRRPGPYPLDQKALYKRAARDRQIDKAKKREDHDRLIRLLNEFIEQYNDKSTPEAQPWDHTDIEEAAKKAEALRMARDVVTEHFSDVETESSQEV